MIKFLVNIMTQKKSIEFRDSKDANTKWIFHVRIYFKEILGFTQHQQNATSGPRYEIKMKGNSDGNATVVGLAGPTNVTHFTIGDTSWYVQHYTPNFPQQLY